MTVLSETFTLLICFGLWKPADWQGWKSKLYNIYTLFLFINGTLFILSEFIQVLLFNDGVLDFINNSSMLMDIIRMCGKITTIIVGRDNIILFMKNLQQHPFEARDKTEEIIQNKYNRIIRYYTISYTVLFEVSVIIFTLGQIFEDRPIGVLPYKAWLPYDYSTPIAYWLTSAQQLMTIFLSAHVDIAFDTFLPGLMFKICAQINVLKYRFTLVLKTLEEARNNTNEQLISTKNLESLENKLFADCVEYHLAILGMVDTISFIFSKMIFIQYSLSSVILCSSVYALTQMPPFSPEFMSCVVYILCMFIQMFNLCMSGNRVTFEFSELTTAIYDTNWFTLSNNARKHMIMMMIKSLTPTVFVSGHIVTLSLDSFKALIKVTYSIYNLFQETSKRNHS